MDEEMLNEVLGLKRMVSLSAGAMENEKSKQTDERYYKKYLIVAVVFHVINCLLQVGYMIMPYLIRSSSQVEWNGGVFLMHYDNQYYQLFKCFGQDDNPCQIKMDVFFQNELRNSDFSSLNAINIIVSFLYKR